MGILLFFFFSDPHSSDGTQLKKQLERTKLRKEEKWGRSLASTGMHSHRSTLHHEQGRSDGLRLHGFSLGPQPVGKLESPGCHVVWYPAASACLPAVSTALGGRACLYFGASFPGRSSQKPINAGAWSRVHTLVCSYSSLAWRL